MVDNNILAEVGKTYDRQVVPVGSKRNVDGNDYMFVQVAASSTYIRKGDALYVDANTNIATVVSQMNIMANAVAVSNIDTSSAAARYALVGIVGSFTAAHYNACTNPINATVETRLASYLNGQFRLVTENVNTCAYVQYGSANSYMVMAAAVSSSNFQAVLAVGDIISDGVGNNRIVTSIINSNAITYAGFQGNGAAIASAFCFIVSADGAAKTKVATAYTGSAYTNLGEYGIDSNINLIWSPSATTIQSPNAIFGTQVKSYDRISALVNGAAQVVYLTSVINAYAATTNATPTFGAVNVHNFNVVAKTCVAKLQ